MFMGPVLSLLQCVSVVRHEVTVQMFVGGRLQISVFSAGRSEEIMLHLVCLYNSNFRNGYNQGTFFNGLVGFFKEKHII